MPSVLNAPEDDIRAAWEILHGSEDDERRNIKKTFSGDYVYKTDKEISVEKIPPGSEFPDPPRVLWIADEDLLKTVSDQRDINLPSV